MTDEQPDPENNIGPVGRLSGTAHLQPERAQLALMRHILREDAPKDDETTRRVSCGIAATLAESAHSVAVRHIEDHQRQCENPSCAVTVDRLVWPMPMDGVEALAAVLRVLSDDGTITAGNPAVRTLVAVLAAEPNSES